MNAGQATEALRGTFSTSQASQGYGRALAAHSWSIKARTVYHSTNADVTEYCAVEDHQRFAKAVDMCLDLCYLCSLMGDIQGGKHSSSAIKILSSAVLKHVAANSKVCCFTNSISPLCKSTPNTAEHCKRLHSCMVLFAQVYCPGCCHCRTGAAVVALDST